MRLSLQLVKTVMKGSNDGRGSGKSFVLHDRPVVQNLWVKTLDGVPKIH